jgi:uncharacterized protein YqeY
MGAPNLTTRLQRALTVTMKERQRPATSALRTALAAIANAEAVPGEAAGGTSGPFAGSVAGVGATDVARRTLAEHERVAIVEDEIAAHHETAALLEAAGRVVEAVEQRLQADVLAACVEPDPGV